MTESNPFNPGVPVGMGSPEVITIDATPTQAAPINDPEGPVPDILPMPTAPATAQMIIDAAPAQVQAAPAQAFQVQAAPAQVQAAPAQAFQVQAAPDQVVHVTQNVPAVQDSNMPAKLLPEEVFGIMDIDFDTDIKFNDLERMPNLKKDEVVRIAFPLFNANNAPCLKMAQVFFSQEHKLAFLAPTDNPGLLKECIAKWGDPMMRFVAIILQYSTDSEGHLPKDGSWSWKLWAYRFGKDKFPEFKDIHKEWNLSSVDITMKCTDVKYQNVTIMPSKGCLFRTNPNVAREIIAQAQELLNKDMSWIMGYKKTDAEILAMVRPPVAQASVNPFGNTVAAPAQGFTTQVGTGIQKTGEFDNLVQNPGGTQG